MSKIGQYYLELLENDPDYDKFLDNLNEDDHEPDETTRAIPAEINTLESGSNNEG